MNEVSAGGITVRDSSIVHESAKERYRSPLGAVPAGSSVKIGLCLTDLPYDSAWLTVYVDGTQYDLEMILDPGYARDAEHAGHDAGHAGHGAGYAGYAGLGAGHAGRDAGYDAASCGRSGVMLHAVILAPDHACVVWYWFRVEARGGARIYYGADVDDNAGIGKVFLNPPTAFQLTVHEPGFKTPDWAKAAIMYQIFPDRFRRSAKGRVQDGLAYHHAVGRTDMRLHERWDEPPAYLPEAGHDNYMPLDLFGGDLPGITESLSYLKGLGVSLIYLNPIFEAYSNHRYNTADYLKIDPALGTEDDFRELVTEAERIGVKVILDGVFSHTGDDSVYFNKYGRYEGLGAWQGAESPYYNWYTFTDYPAHYRSWWGFDTLPEVNEEVGDWIDFIIEGNDSVFNTWSRRGAAGFRLDVADELPDDTIERMRRALKAADPESFLLGEVWEDATTKQSYNVGRRYALGGGLDSVMNYPFAEHTKGFLLGWIDAFAYVRFLVSQSQNYPKEMYYALMNLLSSHDIARARTALAAGVDGKGMSREEQAGFTVSDDDDARADALVRCAAALQYSLPGIPVIYYGDEAGMHGLLDPFNRGTFPAEAFGIDGAFDGGGGAGVLGIDGALDEEARAGVFARGEVPRDASAGTSLAGWYRRLGALRRARRALRTGGALFYSTNGDVVGVLRYCLGGRDAFGAAAADDMLLTVINPDPEPRRIVIDLRAEKECLSFDDLALIRALEPTRAVRLLSSAYGDNTRENAEQAAAAAAEPEGDFTAGRRNAVSAREHRQAIPITSGLLDISVPPLCAEIFEIGWE